MQNQQLKNGEFRVDSDPDGFKKKMQKRSDFLLFGMRNIFFLLAVVSGIIIYIATK